jgi:hypothetical protein
MSQSTLSQTYVDRSSKRGEEFPAIFRESLQRTGVLRIHHQHHERFVRNDPLACDAEDVRRRESEARIKTGMSDDDDEWAAGNLKPLISRRNQLAANALTLMFREDRHRTECRALNRSDNRRAIEDVTDDGAVHRCNKRQRNSVVRSQRVNNPAFVIGPERAPVDLANLRDIVRSLVPNIDRRQRSPPTCGQPRNDQEQWRADRNEK